jgi:hypothetical protein
MSDPSSGALCMPLETGTVSVARVSAHVIVSARV